jgi:hypothetical protein
MPLDVAPVRSSSPWATRTASSFIVTDVMRWAEIYFRQGLSRSLHPDLWVRCQQQSSS